MKTQPEALCVLDGSHELTRLIRRDQGMPIQVEMRSYALAPKLVQRPNIAHEIAVNWTISHPRQES